MALKCSVAQQLLIPFSHWNELVSVIKIITRKLHLSQIQEFLVETLEHPAELLRVIFDLFIWKITEMGDD